MTELKFDEIIEKRLEKIKSTLIEKGKKYRRNNDVFHNFNVGAKMTNQSREKVLYGFLLKHLISFQDMVNDIEADKLPTTEILEEKIGDIVNYCILFEASVKNKISLVKIWNDNDFPKETEHVFLSDFAQDTKSQFREKLKEITNPLKNTQDLIDITNITHT